MKTCPKDAELQAMLAGQLPAGDAGLVEQHLASCARCLKRVEALVQTPQGDRWRCVWAEVHAEPEPANEPALAS